MSAPPFTLLYTREAEYTTKLKKVRKALRLLEQVEPRHPGLSSHACQSVPSPDGTTLWESYVENHKPGAWRIWWIYGPDAEQIIIVTIGPVP